MLPTLSLTSHPNTAMLAQNISMQLVSYACLAQLRLIHEHWSVESSRNPVRADS